jgi:folate-binding protein YgfZ
MTDINFTFLDRRGVVSVGGEDSTAFLQGLVSNDVEKITGEHTAYGALLTPQGKFLYDFFMVYHDGAVILDSEGDRLEGLIRKLKMYKLRSKVDLSDETDTFSIFALYGKDALSTLGLTTELGATKVLGDGIVFTDPRLSEMGARAILPTAQARSIIEGLGFSEAAIEVYDSHRISLGLPDGSRDMVVEKAILLENGFDELGGVDWNKGCFIGQELTARTKHRGLIKKRLIPVQFDGAPPPEGTPVMVDDKEAGEVRSASNDHGLALMRLEYLETPGAEFFADGVRLTPQKPLWAKF